MTIIPFISLKITHERCICNSDFVNNLTNSVKEMLRTMNSPALQGGGIINFLTRPEGRGNAYLFFPALKGTAIHPRSVTLFTP